MGTWVRRTVKGAAAIAVHYSGLRHALAAIRRRQSGGRRVMIVSYHRVVADFTGELQRSIPGLLISQETFRRHLEEASAAGYELTTLDHALDVLAGRRAAKRDLFVVTFDDGYRDVCRYAAPVLRQMGVPATIYLPTGLIGTDGRFQHDRLFHLLRQMVQTGARPIYEAMPPAAAVLLEPIFQRRRSMSAALDDFIAEHPLETLEAVIQSLTQQVGARDAVPEQGEVMGWDEVRALAADGFEIGAHTVHHAVLTLLPPERVDWEIGESKRVIEAAIGRPVRHFAYCNGWYSDVVIEALRRHGFRSAVTTEDLPNVIGSDPFTLKRKVLWENFSVGMLGDYSSALTVCHIDDVFGVVGITQPVIGRRSHAARGALPTQ